jgi:hypothetical protein
VKIKLEKQHHCCCCCCRCRLPPQHVILTVTVIPSGKSAPALQHRLHPTRHWPPHRPRTAAAAVEARGAAEPTGTGRSSSAGATTTWIWQGG